MKLIASHSYPVAYDDTFHIDGIGFSLKSDSHQTVTLEGYVSVSLLVKKYILYMNGRTHIFFRATKFG